MELKKRHPFCRKCGWCKGGLDSWNGKTCKCGLYEEPFEDIMNTIVKPTVNPANVLHVSIVEKRVGETITMNEEDGYCIQDLYHANLSRLEKKFPPLTKYYTDWEKNVFQPWLEKHGFKLLGWRDGERDSFGPLTRVAITRHVDSNKALEIWYG